MVEGYCDGFSKINGEIFFERNPDAFPFIISYYVSKKLHIPRNSCAESFAEETSYWGIPYTVEACCDTYLDDLECVQAMERVYNTANTFQKEVKVEEVATTKFAKMKGKIWNLFENPETSVAAKVRKGTHFQLFKIMKSVLNAYNRSVTKPAFKRRGGGQPSRIGVAATA